MLSSTLTKFFLILATSAGAAEKQDFVIYHAQTRKPEELKAAAQDVLNGGRISVIDSRVIVYGTKSQRDAVLKLFQELDHKLMNFLVRVRVASKGASERAARSIEGELGVGGVKVGSKSGNTPGKGGKVGVKGELGQLQVSADSESASADGNGAQSVVVSDGGHGKIYSDGGVFPSTVDVSVRGVGKKGAHVELRQANTNSLGEQKLMTEINLVLGEWRTIGGIRTKDTGKTSDTLGSSERANESRRDIQIRVDRQDD